MLLRFVAATLLIAMTAILLQARGRNEVFPRRTPLQSFPERLGEWQGTDEPLQQDVLDILGPGEFLVRRYQNPAPTAPEIDLFIAYFPSQKTGDTIHSPKNCLPGAGWSPVQTQQITLNLPGHTPFPANRYVIARAGARQMVLYWYWAHNRGVANEYWAKYYLVKDAIQMNRSDGALVRISTEMFPGESTEAAQQRLLPFASSISPLLDEYIPR